jgi:ribosome maturation factor RimP
LAKIEERVEALVTKPINDLGYEVYDVMYVKEGKDYYLKIFIDNSQGISLNDCEKVNDAITDMLDEADYIKEQYFLEISSPGIERQLRKEKHFEENIGKVINVSLFSAIEKKKEIEGELKDFNKDSITILTEENKEIIIDRKNISLAKLAFKW